MWRRPALAAAWLALGAGFAAAGAPPAGASVEARLESVDAAVGRLVGKLQHSGSAAYWGRFSASRGAAQPPELSAAATTVQGRLKVLEQRLDVAAAHMTTDDEGTRGSQSYWQRHAQLPAPEPHAEVQVMSAAAQAQGCLGEAQAALALAAQQAAVVTKEAADSPSVADHLSIAEDKLECAFAHLAVNNVRGGSADYWGIGGHSFDGAVFHDGRTVAMAGVFVGLALVGSMAAIAVLADPARSASWLGGARAGEAEEPLLQA